MPLASLGPIQGRALHPHAMGIQYWLVLVESLQLAAKENDKYKDNVNEATLKMTVRTATVTTTAATHGDGNHVNNKKSNNAGNNGNNKNGEEDSGRRRRGQRQ